MKVSLQKCLWGLAACFSLWPILLCAQSSDPAQSPHRDNVSNCRSGFDSCDHSELTEPEAIALALAKHQRNVSDCNHGMLSCDPSKLTQSEAGEMAVAEHQRNLNDCEERFT